MSKWNHHFSTLKICGTEDYPTDTLMKLHPWAWRRSWSLFEPELPPLSWKAFHVFVGICALSAQHLWGQADEKALLTKMSAGTEVMAPCQVLPHWTRPLLNFECCFVCCMLENNQAMFKLCLQSFNSIVVELSLIFEFAGDV